MLLVSANRRHRFVRFVTGWGNAYLHQDACDLSLPFPPSNKHQPVGTVFRFLSARNHPWILGVSIVGTQNYALRQKSGLKPQLIIKLERLIKVNLS